MIASPGPVVAAASPEAAACPACGGTVLRLDVSTGSLDCVDCGAALCAGHQKELCPSCGSSEHDSCILTEYDNWYDALADEVHDLELEGGMVDNGIGHYEYWGAKGFDSQVGFEVDDVKDVTIFWTEDPRVPGEAPRYEVKLDKTFHVGRDGENTYVVEVTATLSEYRVARVMVGFGEFIYRHRAVYVVGP